MLPPAQILEFFANALVLGAVLALAAIGLTLVYGILNLPNFAHGDLLTFGALMAIYFATATTPLGPIILAGGLLLVLFGLVPRLGRHRLRRVERIVVAAAGGIILAAGAPLLIDSAIGGSTYLIIVAALAAVAATVALTAATEFLLWRPLRRRRSTSLALILSSIGLSLVLRHALQLRFGPGLLSFDRPLSVSSTILGARISEAQLLTLVLAPLLVGGLHLFLQRTRTGKEMRAVADNPELARVSGIDVERIILYVWIISGALVAIAGVLFTLVNNNTMQVSYGAQFILALFAACILGGIGSPYGAIAAAFVIGFAMKFLPYMAAALFGLPRLTHYEPAFAFLLLILALILRPQGIFRRRYV